MKRLIAILLVLSIVFSFAACAKSEQTTKAITIYTWEGMFPQEVLDAFEEKSGYEINYVTFDTDETMLAKLEASNGSDYDIIIADDYIIEQVIAEGLAKELDTTKLSNYKNINTKFQGQFYDPTDSYSVPYGAGIVQIAYNADKVDFEITGYKDLFNPSLKGRVGVMDNNRVVTGLMLKMLGYSMNTENEKEINAAGQKLVELSKNIGLIKTGGYINEDLVAGTIDVALVYQSEATLAYLNDSGVNIKLVKPSEGIGYGVMAMFIPSKAPNANGAYAFMDYILDGEVAAQCFEWMGYCSTNTAADLKIQDDYKDLLTLPESLNLTNSEIVQNVSTKTQDLHMEVWDNFVISCG